MGVGGLLGISLGVFVLIILGGVIVITLMDE